VPPLVEDICWDFSNIQDLFQPLPLTVVCHRLLVLVGPFGSIGRIEQ
jgi:hypothetical protein